MPSQLQGFSTLKAAMPWLQRLVALLFVVAVWQFVVNLQVIPDRYLPPPSGVVFAFAQMVLSGELVDAELLTLGRAFLALIASVSLAMLLAGLGVIFKPVREAMRGIAELLRPIPPAAVVPLAVFVLGTNLKLYLFVACLVAVWPTYLSAVSAFEGVSDVLRQTGRSFGCSRLSLLLFVMLPQALPEIFVGIRLSAAISLIAIVVTEMLAGQSGLGNLIFRMAFAIRVPEVYAITLLCGINGILFSQLILLLRHMASGWHLKFLVESAA
ncbi:MAG: ABC transporter permease subunit [Proteobacteria bacterium]|nr:ABC transporter permease subunit [Pseudomonadota bacterium]